MLFVLSRVPAGILWKRVHKSVVCVEHVPLLQYGISPEMSCKKNEFPSLVIWKQVSEGGMARKSDKTKCTRSSFNFSELGLIF